MDRGTLGIDIGGVIIDRVNDNTDTSFFGDRYLETTAVKGAFEAIRELVRRRFGEIHLVSKCGVAVQVKTQRWLNHHNFFGETAVLANNLWFCRKRNEKAGICEKLRITHFIDDRLEVLSHLASVEHRFLFQPRPDEVEAFKEHLSRVSVVNSWQEVLKKLLP